VIAEHALKRTNVSLHVAPLVLEGRPVGKEHYHKEMLRDPELLWKLEPGSRVFGRQINSLGFREREVAPEKKKGVRRVICMGDSVTAQGQPGYSQFLHELLTNAPPDGGSWEAFNMGVYGYSSLQGLRLFQLRGKALRPDVVTISYGRNDHNLAEVADQVRMAVRLSPFMKGFYEFFSHRLVGEMLLHALDRRHQWSVEGEAAQVRVPPETFRDNMRLFVSEVRSIGATPILVTAPRRQLPDSYVKGGYARTVEEFAKQHDDYAQIVRDVAHETGAPLLDLQRLLAGPECDSYFASDKVHFDAYDREGYIPYGSEKQPGLYRIATEMYAIIKARFAVPSPAATPTP